MPESAITTPNRGYTLVRKALNDTEVWDWFGEYLTLWTAVDADVQSLADLVAGGGDLEFIKFQTDANPALTPEGTVWWNGAEHTLNLATGLGPVLQVNQETVLLFFNNTGSVIPNGAVVRPEAAVLFGGEIFPTPQLAKADNHANCEGTLSLATHDVADGALGVFTRFGRIRELDTLLFGAGDTVWLSPTVDGGITATKPDYPDFSISLGGCLNSDATAGEIFVSITRDELDLLHSAHDGSFVETIDFLVGSDGSIVTGTLTNADDGTRDLTMLFSDGMGTFDATPGANVVLTPGSDNNPQLNYVYIPITTKVLTVSTSSWPAGEHIRVAQCLVQSAATTQADTGALKNQNWNDHVKSVGGNGHLLHLAYAIREKLGATWKSGTEGSVSIVTNGGAPDDVYVTVTGGTIMQLHDQSFDTFDTSAGDDMLVANDNVLTFRRTSNLNSELTDAEGNPLNELTFSIILWGVGNKTSEPDFLMVNLPLRGYDIGGPHGITLAEAINDINNYAVYDIPASFQGTGFLIARFTFTHDNTASGTWTLEDTEDLRGKVPNLTAGGSAGGSGVTTYLGLTDTSSSYTGQAYAVPSVNVGETGLEFIDHAAAHEAGGVAEVDHNALTIDGEGTDHYNSAPTTGNDAYRIADAITGNPDAAVEQRDLSLVAQTAVSTMSDEPEYVLANDDYIIINEGSVGDNFRRYDRITFDLLQAYSGATFWGSKPCAIAGDKVVFSGTDAIFELEIDNFEINSSITATGVLGVGCCRAYSQTILYFVSTGATPLQIATRGASSYSVSSYALPGLTGDVEDIVFSSDLLHFFVADVSGGTSVVVRKYDVATRALQNSSTPLSGAYNTNVGALGLAGENIFVTAGRKAYILDPSGLTTLFGPGSLNASGTGRGVVFDGLLYTADLSNSYLYQPPGLTHQTPAVVDATATTSINKTADGRYYTNEDIGRHVLSGENYIPYPETGDKAFEVNESTAITDSAVKSIVDMRDITLLRTSADTIGDPGYWGASIGFLVFSSTGSNLVLLDRHSLRIIKTVGSVNAGQPVFTDERKGYVLRATSFTRFYADINGLTVSASQSASLATSFISAAYNRANALAYYVDDTGASFILKSFDPSDETVASVGSPLTGITGSVLGLAVSDDSTSYYVLDRAGVSIYIRAYTASGGAPTWSSDVIPASSSSASRVFVNKDNIAVIVRGSTAILSVAYVSFSGTVLKIFSGSVEGAISTVSESVGYTLNQSDEPIEFQLPGLTDVAPRALDGRTLDSSIFSHRDYGQQSHVDWMRAASDTTQLDQTRLGVNVISVVTSTSSEITNAVVGQRYLISDASTLNNYIFEKRSDGAHWYSPKLGNLVTNLDTGETLWWYGSAWGAIGFLSSTAATDLTDGFDTTLHFHQTPRYRETVRTTAVSDDIEETDENKVIVVPASRTANVALTPTAGLLALEGAQFSVVVGVNPTYPYVTLGGAFRMDGDDGTNSLGILRYRFTVLGGAVVPDGRVEYVPPS